MRSILALATAAVLTLALAVGLVVHRAKSCSDGTCVPLQLPAGVPQK